jgi:FkbM family methyltransferase
MPDAGCRMPDAGCRMPDAGCRISFGGDMPEQMLRSGPDSPPVRTLIPGQKAIELVTYYLHQLDYYPECELQTKRWFVENVQPDWVMFDVGANIGYYSILFSRLAPAGQIYAFEPTATFSMLEENLAYSGCCNVKPMRIAVGMVSGAVEDNVFRIWGNDPERQIYNFSTVDDLVQRLELTRLDCMKIDVDSFDFEVLMGAERTLKHFNPWVVVELCHALSKRNQSVQEALEWLIAKGYRKSHVLDQTSFVLRRDPETLSDARTDEPDIRLTFENRPVILPPLWVKEAPIENLFAAEALPHNNAKIGRDSCKRLSLCVPGPRWAYACSWLRRADAEFERPFVVECRLQVSGGAIGLGCLVDDMTGYVTKEVDIAPRDEPQTVLIYVENQAAAKHLVLRNIDPAGREAQVTILELACFAAGGST